MRWAISTTIASSRSIHWACVSGLLCTGHTYDCYCNMTQVHEACCDKEGLNCIEGQDLPSTCPVGCVVVFPEFLETCREYIRQEELLVETNFESFERECLDQDGLALVEYSLMLQESRCALNFTEIHAPAAVGGGH